MRLFIPFLLILTFFISSCESNTRDKAVDENINTNEESRELVWADEFDYEGSPDSTKWVYDIGGHGWGNNELQYYTDDLKNAKVVDGNLIIEAIKEPFEENEYTSARLVTKGKGDWQYGRIEVRAKLPSGVGTWPAIWMLPTLDRDMSWPADGEIDIMEHVGFDQGVIHGTIHTEAYNHMIGTQKAGQMKVQDASEDFHVYAIDWSADSISWFINDQKYFTYENEDLGKAEWPFDNPFHLILNIAVGGGWGGQQGVDENIWPQQMVVDWVRVYQ